MIETYLIWTSKSQNRPIRVNAGCFKRYMGRHSKSSWCRHLGFLEMLFDFVCLYVCLFSMGIAQPPLAHFLYSLDHLEPSVHCKNTQPKSSLEALWALSTPSAPRSSKSLINKQKIQQYDLTDDILNIPVVFAGFSGKEWLASSRL